MSPLDALTQNVGHIKTALDSTVVFNVAGFPVTQYFLFMVLIWILTIVLIISVGKRLTLIPTNKFINTVEYGYQLVSRDVSQNVIGDGYKRHVPFLATLFFFILISNFCGLIPGSKTPTGSISINWALATCSFFYFNYWGIKAHGGWGYVKSIAPSGLPKVLVPVIWFFETVSLFLRWLTLSVRLYGNMFAGHMVLGIFALATGVFMTVGIQSMQVGVAGVSLLWFLLLVVMYALETLVAFLQAYVFTMLSSVYISLAVSEH